MRCLWCSQLPFLLIIPLLGASWSNQIVYAEALIVLESAAGNCQQKCGWVGRYPFVRSRSGPRSAHKLKDPDSSPLLPKNVSSCTATSSPAQNLTAVSSSGKAYKSRKTKIAESVGGDLGIPTLTPSKTAYYEKSRKPKIVVVVGACLGATLLVVITLVLVYLCLMRIKRIARRTSESESSAPSLTVDWTRESGSPHAVNVPPYEANVMKLTIAELENSTSSFSESHVIGEGGFGLAYKGLLQDGSIVAIKRRIHDPTQTFVHEVENIGRIHHKHLVRLIGYSQENHQQLLVYEFLPNCNVGNHIYGALSLSPSPSVFLCVLSSLELTLNVYTAFADSEGLPIGKLDIRQRLSIGVGAAKGLEYLHSLVPPFLHMHFRTRNVLVDDHFSVKVSDFGLSKLVVDSNRAGSSSAIDCFLDPELRLSNDFFAKSDVYSFGVFLLELTSGREALDRNQSEPSQNLVRQAKAMRSIDDFVDVKLRGKSAAAAVQRIIILALMCVDTGSRRPTMKMVLRELELIQESESGDVGEGLSVVTLGSELFK
ncbi:hypothetical protein C5167_001106 [Papaver somniferum]|uniref:non-specific serine/threonine protein kinase n=1 Tax=Papaver somniferum TaxID=3469 RepID=A0A4Y7KXL8_PAPSO|nr:hypothetical protein C5167_001106 [Papaver somniferum]